MMLEWCVCNRGMDREKGVFHVNRVNEQMMLKMSLGKHLFDIISAYAPNRKDLGSQK